MWIGETAVSPTFVPESAKCNLRKTIMTKGKNSKKKSSNQPAKTAKEKKQAKREKRDKQKEGVITHES
jgi:hypothetical protein